MIRFLKVLIFIAVALVVVFLSVANRHLVTVSLDPFSKVTPEFSFTAPLFLVLFGAGAIGVVVGGIAAWWAQHGNRRELRHSRREVRALKAEVEKARGEALPPHSSLPVSGNKAA